MCRERSGTLTVSFHAEVTATSEPLKIFNLRKLSLILSGNSPRKEESQGASLSDPQLRTLGQQGWFAADVGCLAIHPPTLPHSWPS